MSQPLPGFRECYPEEMARRCVLLDAWRRTARASAFEEYDGPTLEPLDLYAKKNAGGEEILGQLYQFEDGGGRRVALRPELTPTLARMAGAREKHYRKPMRWFSIGSFFRYERQQRGRLREFLQLNCDLLGEEGPGADAEIVALAANCLLACGLRQEDFIVRLSHRGAWKTFLEGRGLDPTQCTQTLAIVDKIGRESEENLATKLAAASSGKLGISDIQAFRGGPTPDELGPVLADLAARGLSGCVQVDLSIVRGLAYYTGIVFEIFDRAGRLRALAGGGRYDGLLAALGGADLPAVGFGIGDVVVSELLTETPHAAATLEAGAARLRSCDVYVVVADETRRHKALALVSTLRQQGFTVDFALSPAKVGRQFQAAERAGARQAVVVGSEWPEVAIKELASRQEERLSHEALAGWLRTRQLTPSR